MNDIIVIRADAHFNYVYERIHDEKKQCEFFNAFIKIRENIQDNLPFRMSIGSDKHGGKTMAVEMMESIIETTEKRFGDKDNRRKMGVKKL